MQTDSYNFYIIDQNEAGGNFARHQHSQSHLEMQLIKGRLVITLKRTRQSNNFVLFTE